MYIQIFSYFLVRQLSYGDVLAAIFFFFFFFVDLGHQRGRRTGKLLAKVHYENWFETGSRPMGYQPLLTHRLAHFLPIQEEAPAPCETHTVAAFPP
jgi:hypothetical protein